MSQWDSVLSNMFQICWDRRSKFPVPSSCRDYQLYEFYDEMQWYWNLYDNIMKRDDMDADERRIILEKLYYYETMIEDIEYEFERRPWLS